MLNDILGAVTGAQQGNALQAVTGLIQNHEGGLQGLVSSFHQGGLGEAVNSWISTGANLPISPEQITQVLGGETVQNLASQLGISPDVAAEHLTTLLPGLINQITPNGLLPEGPLADVFSQVTGGDPVGALSEAVSQGLGGNLGETLGKVAQGGLGDLLGGLFKR
ncbi:MAG: YidB family protein [Asticcacaulis sp.]